MSRVEGAPRVAKMRPAAIATARRQRFGWNQDTGMEVAA
jgi:hypothetical protein